MSSLHRFRFALIAALVGLALLLGTCVPFGADAPALIGSDSASATPAAAASEAPVDSGLEFPAPDWRDPTSFQAAFEAYGFHFEPLITSEAQDVRFGTSADDLVAIEIVGSDAVQRITLYDATRGADGVDEAGFFLALLFADSQQVDPAVDWLARTMELAAAGVSADQQVDMGGIGLTFRAGADEDPFILEAVQVD